MSRQAFHRVHGLTLIEMLVTLVLVSLVATILGQALHQLARIERLLEGGQLRSASDAVRADWVRSALESLLPGGRESERLTGGERELQGLSADVPGFPAPGLAMLRLALRTDDAGASTVLELLPEDKNTAGTKPVVLLSWPGREGRFRYLDAQGQWVDRWPPATITGQVSGAGDSLVPRLIVLETGQKTQSLVVARPRASPHGLPTRKQLEAL